MMRLTDYDKLQLKLREYADKKAANGEIELANGILKAKCFIDQECEIVNEKQLSSGWIPVSEKLPENNVKCLVTVQYENFAGIYSMVTTGAFNDKKIALYGEQPVISNRKVIAWMPLPEPFKEVENE